MRMLQSVFFISKLSRSNIIDEFVSTSKFSHVKQNQTGLLPFSNLFVVKVTVCAGTVTVVREDDSSVPRMACVYLEGYILANI